ncbi:MAG: XRE family transcriptional regulator [Clostridia bacterium]|nr:XRE family transcriptional regulator [Clostridia bacterium]
MGIVNTVTNELKKRISVSIQTQRRAKGWTQSELAEKAGYSMVRSVGCWEKGEAITLPLLEKLSKLFECDIGYLLGEYEEETKSTSDLVAKTGLTEKAVERLRMLHKGAERSLQKRLTLALVSDMLESPSFLDELQYSIGRLKYAVNEQRPARGMPRRAVNAPYNALYDATDDIASESFVSEEEVARYNAQRVAALFIEGKLPNLSRVIDERTAHNKDLLKRIRK